MLGLILACFGSFWVVLACLRSFLARFGSFGLVLGRFRSPIGLFWLALGLFSAGFWVALGRFGSF